MIAVFAVACLVAVTGFVFETLMFPHGFDDSMDNWNLKARLLASWGDDWTRLYQDAQQHDILFADHPDYPLLIPGAVARLWNAQHSLSAWSPALVAFSFTAATVLLTVGAVAVLRGMRQGILAGMILLGTVYLVLRGASQYADVPLACYLAAACALLALNYQMGGKSYGTLALAGLCAGLGAWTKNEGNLALVSLLAAHLLIALVQRQWKLYLRQLAAILAGLLPILVVLAYFKVKLATGTDIFAAQRPGAAWECVRDPARYRLIAAGFVNGYWRVGRGVSLVLPVYLLLAGLRPGWRREPGLWLCAATLCLMLAGQAAVYLITPLDLRWHVSSSVDRLVFHLWPTLIVLVFLLAAPLGAGVASSPPPTTES